MRIAVIGAGIAGLGAAWLMNGRHEVVLYEAEGRLGGHSNTVDAPTPGGGSQPVDTGFIVFNDRTYPNLLALFRQIGVQWRPSSMSFSVSVDGGRLEYSGDGIGGLFAQRYNFIRAGHYRMLADLLRFYRQAPAVLQDPSASAVTLGQYLEQERYGRAFIHDHLLPMSAAIWSCGCDEILGFPLQSYVSFCHNHGLLSVGNRPQWRTVEGGSRDYVRRLTQPLEGRVRSGVPVTRVTRLAHGVIVRDASGQEDRFDQVVLACHADQALAMLANPTPEERGVLAAFRYQTNSAVLHRDEALMPRRRRVWSSWNYLAGKQGNLSQSVSVTYWMNRLQSLDTEVPVFVSLNPLQEPDPNQTIAAFSYEHPVFDSGATAAQAALGGVQGRDRLWFCGAYCGHGFHEDGLASGLAVAEGLGVRRPWTVQEVSPAGTNARPRFPMIAAAAE